MTTQQDQNREYWARVKDKDFEKRLWALMEVTARGQDISIPQDIRLLYLYQVVSAALNSTIPLIIEEVKIN